MANPEKIKLRKYITEALKLYKSSSNQLRIFRTL